LDQRVVAKNALNPERLPVAFNPQCDDLILAIRELEHGDFRAMLKAARGAECNLIGGR
jgi:hypothetical protein